MDNSPAMKTFSENVRTALTDYGWSIQDLADQCGIARPNLSRIIGGKEGVTLDRAERIASALDLELSDMLQVPTQV